MHSTSSSIMAMLKLQESESIPVKVGTVWCTKSNSTCYNNILSNLGEDHNFAKYSAAETNDLKSPYDVQSIMHYGRYSFSKNGEPTIVAIGQKEKTLGQRARLSNEDATQLNRLYKCKGNAMKSFIFVAFALARSGNLFLHEIHNNKIIRETHINRIH